MTDTVNVDWKSAPEEADALAQSLDWVRWFNTKTGKYRSEDNHEWYKRSGWTIIARRPKPPLTDEQMEAVIEYDDWLGGTTCGNAVNRWLEERSK